MHVHTGVHSHCRQKGSRSANFGSHLAPSLTKVKHTDGFLDRFLEQLNILNVIYTGWDGENFDSRLCVNRYWFFAQALLYWVPDTGSISPIMNTWFIFMHTCQYFMYMDNFLVKILVRHYVSENHWIIQRLSVTYHRDYSHIYWIKQNDLSHRRERIAFHTFLFMAVVISKFSFYKINSSIFFLYCYAKFCKEDLTIKSPTHLPTQWYWDMCFANGSTVFDGILSLSIIFEN